MRAQELLQLQAEKGAIEQLLAELPEEHEIEKLGLQSRLNNLREKIALQIIPEREPIRTKLTFRGKPIVGNRGVFAEFGASAISAFTEAITAIGASQSGPLGTRGVLPSIDGLQMLITGTAIGSFGFQLEEAPQDSISGYPANPPLELALHQARNIMKASLKSDDDALTEALADTDPRALEAIRKFLETMVKNEAVCSLDFKGECFRFADVEQVRQSVARLEQDNIHEESIGISGKFLGVLPHRRTFEFIKLDDETIISGRVSKDVEDPSSINKILGTNTVIQVRIRRVGEGNPSYTLLSFKSE